MNYYVFSDVHGCLGPLLEALAAAGYDDGNPAHHLLFLGDAFDKPSPWRDDYGVYIYLRCAVEAGKLTWILGNHDAWLASSIRDGHANHFTRDTVRLLAEGLAPGQDLADERACIDVLAAYGVGAFLDTYGVDYYETAHYVFTHAFVPWSRKQGRIDEHWRDAERTRWNACRSENGMKRVMDGLRISDKTLVSGHVGACYGNICLRHPDVMRDSAAFDKIAAAVKHNARQNADYFRAYVGDGVIGMDGWAYATGMVNVLVVED